MSTTRACDHCGSDEHKTPGIALVAMQPGPDGAEWYLCAGCWAEGRAPFKLGRFKVTMIEDPHLADALRASARRTAKFIDHGTTDEPTKSPKPRRSRKQAAG